MLKFAAAVGSIVGVGFAAGWTMADENHPKVKKVRRFATDNAPVLMLASLAVGSVATSILLDRKFLSLPVFKSAKKAIFEALEAGENVYIQLTPCDGWRYVIGDAALETAVEAVKEV